MAFSMLFPPSGKLRQDVRNHDLFDEKDDKALSLAFPYMKLEKFIRIYRDLDQFKSRAGVYVVEALADKHVSGVNVQRRVIKIGRDLFVPKSLTRYLYYYGPWAEGNQTTHGVKIYMLVVANKNKDDPTPAKKRIINLEESIHTILRNNKELKELSDEHLQWRGNERYLLKLGSIRRMVNTMKKKMVYKKKMLQALTNSLDKEFILKVNKIYVVNEEFTITDVESEDNEEHIIKKGTRWRYRGLKNDLLRFTRHDDDKTKKGEWVDILISDELKSQFTILT